MKGKGPECLTIQKLSPEAVGLGVMVGFFWGGFVVIAAVWFGFLSMSGNCHSRDEPIWGGFRLLTLT